MTRKADRIARALAAVTLPLIAAWHPPRALAADAEVFDSALNEQLASDGEAATSQKHIDDLDDETRQLVAQYRQLTGEARSLNNYADQMAVQIDSQVGEMESIEEQMQEIETTAREVLPMMQRMLETLDQFVQLDVPFQLDERQKRVATLREMMKQADVTISEKYRRIIEAYQIETDYGRTLEVFQGVLGEGDTARTVQFLRIGRVALLYQTLDGKETGYWDADKKGWVVDNSYRQHVRKGFEVAQKLGAPDLLVMPIPAPKGDPS